MKKIILRTFSLLLLLSFINSCSKTEVDYTGPTFIAKWSTGQYCFIDTLGNQIKGYGSPDKIIHGFEGKYAKIIRNSRHINIPQYIDKQGNYLYGLKILRDWAIEDIQLINDSLIAITRYFIWISYFR